MMKRIPSYHQNNKAIVYLVATPIGNLSEISSRALDILKSVDVIACEDTRNSGILLKHFGIAQRTIAYHNFNEEESTKGILSLLSEGKSIALITDAGYPLLSDPGFELVHECRKQGYPVSTISGPNAGLNALVASGLDTTHFYFYGFLNSKPSQARKELEELKSFKNTLIFYEAPHRIEKTIELMVEVLGNREVCLARELTKIHEEYITGTLEELKELHDLKGEMVLIVSGNKEKEEISLDEVMNKVDELISQGIKAKDACGEMAKKHNLSKNELYKKYLKDNA